MHKIYLDILGSFQIGYCKNQPLLIISGSQNISKFSHLIAYVGGNEKKEELSSTS